MSGKEGRLSSRDWHGAGAWCSELLKHDSAGAFFPPSSKTASSVLNTTQEDIAPPRLCPPRTLEEKTAPPPRLLVNRRGVHGGKVAILFKVNDKLSNIYASGARQSFRRTFQGVGFRKSPGAKAPFW